MAIDFWTGASYMAIAAICSLFAVLWYLQWRTTRTLHRRLSVQAEIIDFQERRQQLSIKDREEIVRAAFAKALAQEPTYVQPTSRRTH